MFVFYDTETTGVDHDFCQILQIALVFTDDNLNILSSKKVECRRSPWIVPAPGAMLITGFMPDDLKNNASSHYEMMREVDAWVRAQHWPVIFVGYNSLTFDEPVLARNLHTALLDPGLTTAGNGHNTQSNGRADVMQMVRALQVYMPGALKLDTLNEVGKPSLSLINVAQQNGVVLTGHDAHDAMNDIRATVGVAKAIKKAAPALWDHFSKMATRDGVEDFISKNSLFTYMNYSFGKMKTPVSTALRAGGKTVLFDVSFDPAAYLKMTPEQLAACLTAKFEARDRQPFTMTDAGAAPALVPMDLSDAVLPATFDEDLAIERSAALKADAAFLTKLEQALEIVQKAAPRKKYPEQLSDAMPADPVRAKLQGWMDRFHAADWKEKAVLAAGFQEEFKDELQADESLSRFAKFGLRIIFEQAPEELCEEKYERMLHYTAVRLLNPDLKAPYMTIPKARKELEKIEQDRKTGAHLGKWKDVTDGQVRSLKLYYTALEKEYAPYLDAKKPPAAPPAAAANDNPRTDISAVPSPDKKWFHFWKR